MASVRPHRPTRLRIALPLREASFQGWFRALGKDPVLNVSVPDKRAGLSALCSHSPVSPCRSSHSISISQAFIPLPQPLSATQDPSRGARISLDTALTIYK